MSSRLTDKKCRVIVVDPSGPVRQMMADTTRAAMGFETVEARPSVQDVLSYLEVDTVDWIIAPLMADQPINALHLLKTCCETPELKSVRISLCLDETELYVLPSAFSLGMLSWFKKPLAKDSLTEELKQLAANLEAGGANEPLVAGDYLQAYLKETNNHHLQVELAKSLLELYPGRAQILLNLVEPQFHLGQKDIARRTLGQVGLVDAGLADKANELAKALFGENAPEAVGDDTQGLNLLGARNAIVVDSDDASARSIEDTLKALGVTEVQRFANGVEAWTAVEGSSEPDLIVLEWRIPKLSGPMLIQRIRHHGFLSVPIVVLSSLLKPEDLPLVREIGVANVIAKPLNRELFVPKVIGTMQQERLPTEQQVLERKIRQLLHAGKKDEAESLKIQLLADPHTNLGRKRLVEAEFAFAAGDYPLARDAAAQALKLSGDGILALNLLGKVFMRLSDYEAALKCFKRAQDLSPHNIERLCNMAEVHAELGDKSASRDAINGASALDSDSQAVTEAEARLAITNGDTAGARSIMGQLESLRNLVAYMNNKAVAHAKCGLRDEAVALYKKTIESIPDDRPAMKAIVLYNLALAQVKDGDCASASETLEQVLQLENSKISKKAQSLKERLSLSLKQGTDFKLKQVETTESPKPEGTVDAEQNPVRLTTEEDHLRLLAGLEPRRGDMCCYLVFHNVDPADDNRAAKLLADMPRFCRRDAIEREESLGVDRPTGT